MRVDGEQSGECGVGTNNEAIWVVGDGVAVGKPVGKVVVWGGSCFANR